MSTLRWMMALGVVGAMGCGVPEFRRLDVHKLAGDLEADVGPDGLLVPRGGVLMFEVQPVAESDSPDYKGWEEMELSSTQPGAAEVRPAIVRDAWVLNGKQAGSGSIRVTLDGELVETLDFEVEEVVR